MSRREMLDVVVIGAGVVGASAALALAQQGLRVAIVEAHAPAAWSPASPDLRVYAFAPDSQSLMQSLGVWPAIAGARVHPYPHMCIWDAAGGGELHFDADAIGRSELGHIVEHGLLVDRLWSAVLADLRIARHCPDKIRGIEQDADAATAVLDSGLRLRARLLLGADGAASRVRDLVELAVNERDYGQRGLVAYVTTQHHHQDTAWQRFLPTGPLAFLPCADGRSSIVWTLPTAEAERIAALDDAAFCRELTRAFDARLGEITACSARAAFPLRRQLARAMVSGRVALVGDAAHAVHPLAGQGVNLGLRDVAALRDSVQAAIAAGRDFSAPHRIARWARERVSDSAVAGHAFEAINAVFSNDAVLPTLLRGQALALAGKLPPVANFFLRRAAGLP